MMFRNTITILIDDVRPRARVAADARGADGCSAQFLVVDGQVSSYGDLATRLEDAIPSAQLVSYQGDTGRGVFVTSMGDEPFVGAVYDLSQRRWADPVWLLFQGAAEADKSPPTLEAYYDALYEHPWQYSLDPGRYRDYWKGEANFVRLEAIARTLGGDYAALFDAFRRHHFSGPSFSASKWDLPDRPNDGVLVRPSPPNRSEPPVPEPRDFRIPTEPSDAMHQERRQRRSHEFHGYVAHWVSAAIDWHLAQRTVTERSFFHRTMTPTWCFPWSKNGKARRASAAALRAAKEALYATQCKLLLAAFPLLSSGYVSQKRERDQ